MLNQPQMCGCRAVPKPAKFRIPIRHFLLMPLPLRPMGPQPLPSPSRQTILCPLAPLGLLTSLLAYAGLEFVTKIANALGADQYWDGPGRDYANGEAVPHLKGAASAHSSRAGRWASITRASHFFKTNNNDNNNTFLFCPRILLFPGMYP